MKKNAFTSTVFYLWTLVVFVLLVAPASLFSSGQKPLIPFLHTDKIIHFVMFGFFAFFLYFYLLQKALSKVGNSSWYACYRRQLTAWQAKSCNCLPPLCSAEVSHGGTLLQTHWERLWRLLLHTAFAKSVKHRSPFFGKQIPKSFSAKRITFAPNF